MINCTPATVHNYANQEYPARGGGVVVIRASHRPGLGWDILTITPPHPDDKTDRGMLSSRTIAEGLDLWTACRLFNELAIEEEGRCE